MSHRPTFYATQRFITFEFSDLMTALTYALTYNFCPCFHHRSRLDVGNFDKIYTQRNMVLIKLRQI